MSRPTKIRTKALLTSLAVVLILGVLGCSVDSPTAPEQVASDPPNAGADSWKISLRVSPDQIQSGSDVPATVKVDVESRTDGSNPPNGTTLTLSTSLGDFEAPGSDIKSVGVSLYKGEASALLFAGDIAAGGTVTARLGGSEKRDTFQVLGEAEDMFISAVSPNSGTESGGTRVTIHGVGFEEPLRVFIHNALATVTAVSSTSISAITPALPPGTLTTVECGTGGKQYIPLPVDVEVENANGSTDTLVGGYSYTPDNGKCLQ
jgi:hypothetical protein